MATVFLARQTRLDRLVALKGLVGLRVSEPGFAERFLREAKLAGSLNAATRHLSESSATAQDSFSPARKSTE